MEPDRPLHLFRDRSGRLIASSYTPMGATEPVSEGAPAGATPDDGVWSKLVSDDGCSFWYRDRPMAVHLPADGSGAEAWLHPDRAEDVLGASMEVLDSGISLEGIPSSKRAPDAVVRVNASVRPALMLSCPEPGPGMTIAVYDGQLAVWCPVDDPAAWLQTNASVQGSRAGLWSMGAPGLLDWAAPVGAGVLRADAREVVASAAAGTGDAWLPPELAAAAGVVSMRSTDQGRLTLISSAEDGLARGRIVIEDGDLFELFSEQGPLPLGIIAGTEPITSVRPVAPVQTEGGVLGGVLGAVVGHSEPASREQLCASGHAESCARLADQLYRVDGELERAGPLAVQACEGGHPAGCYTAAMVWSDEANPDRDLPLALDYLVRSCDGGLELGCRMVSMVREQGHWGEAAPQPTEP